MKTYSAKAGEVERKWWILDATDKVLGRMSSRVAIVLRGKNKPQFTPHADVGDFVIVINADKVKLTGNKLTQKQYYHHSGYAGGIKSISAEKLLETKPEEIVVHAIKGMLPKNKLGTSLLKKLKVYAGAEHPHEAQKPLELDIS